MTATVLNKSECNLLKEILDLNKKHSQQQTIMTTTTMTSRNVSNSTTNDNNNNINNNRDNNFISNNLMMFNNARQNDNTTTTTTTNRKHLINNNNYNLNINVEDDDEDDDDEEFKAIFKRKANLNSDFNKNVDKLSLRYLYKLLKLYKLEHYMNDLIDCGYYTAISLNDLSNKDFEKFNVSAYDLKRFSKLQAFIKQVMHTLKASSTNNTNNTNSKRIKQNHTTTNNINNNTNSVNSHHSTTATTNHTNNTNMNKNNIKTAKSVTSVNTPTWESKVDTKSSTQLNNNNKNSRPASSITKIKKQELITPIANKQRSKSFDANENMHHAATHATQSSVHHLTQKGRKHKGTLFGPKLLNNQVQLVEMKNYNYGVPKGQQQQQQQQQQQNGKKPNMNRNTKTATTHEPNSGEANFEMADIYVFARKRPKLACEINLQDAVFVEDQNTIIINEAKSAVDGTEILRQNEFKFDKTFDSTLNNEDIFRTSILPYIDDVNNRVDFSCICFGQTGSGKTHTLFGSKSSDGICAMTVQKLFSQNEKIVCGFYEIYNSQLYDLFNQNSRLVLREDSNGFVNVVGLVEIQLKSVLQLKKAIETGQANRHIGCTSFNKASSRSHAVLQIRIISSAPVLPQTSRVYPTSSQTKQITTTNSRILFIDLAGSERGIDAQNNQKDNRKEGAEINQSLLALKECIRCIDQFQTHAPFRQSKLTRVLRDCFIGCGQTILIATVSPTDDCVQYSLNTLQYANRVRQMTLRGRKKHNKMSQVISSRSTDTQHNLHHHQQQHNNHVLSNNSNMNSSRSTKYEQIENEEPVIISASSRKYINNNNVNVQTSVNNNGNLVKSASMNLPTKPAIVLEYDNPKFKVNTNNGSSEDDMKARFKKLQQQQKRLLNNKDINTMANAASGPNVSNQQPSSLFHPSRINMASTPIKTNPHENKITVFEESLSAQDTPVKGHKIKQNTLIPDRYFEAAANGADQQQSNEQLMRQNYANLNFAQEYEEINDQNEVNKSFENKIRNDQIQQDDDDAPYYQSIKEQKLSNINRITERYMKRFSHLYSPMSSNNSSLAEAAQLNQHESKPTNSQGNSKQIQEQIYQSEIDKLSAMTKGEKNVPIKSKNSSNQNNETSQNLNSSFTSDSHKHLENFSNNFESTLTSKNEDTQNPNTQNQLKTYIQTLEKKLQSLRAEMNTSTQNGSRISNINPKIETNVVAVKEVIMKRCESDNESIDSMREVIEINELKNYLKTSKIVGNINPNKNNINDPHNHKFMSPNLSEASTFMDSSESSNGSPDTEALKRSLHRGTDNLYERVKAVTVSLSMNRQNSLESNTKNKIEEASVSIRQQIEIKDENNDLNQQFKSLNDINGNMRQISENKNDNISGANNNNNNNSFSAKLIQDDNIKIRNPIPLRYNSNTPMSSSGESKLQQSNEFAYDVNVQSSGESFKNNQQTALNDSISGKQFLQPNSSLWKTQQQQQQSKPPITYHSFPPNNQSNTNYENMYQSTSGNHLTDNASNFRRANTLNLNHLSPHTLNRTKSQLVVAHENQLCDITETCKEEMSLLANLKESHVDFDEYLQKVDEMLTRKALSIRDFQQQINQLKTMHNVTSVEVIKS